MKVTYRIFLLTVLLFIGQLSFGQRMDVKGCKNLIVACDSIPIQSEQFSYIIGQCRILANRYLKETERIKKLSTLEERKNAADSVNSLWKDEYGVYNSMIRILKSEMSNENSNLGRLNTVEAEHLLHDDMYINRLFTIFRSKYEF